MLEAENSENTPAQRPPGLGHHQRAQGRRLGASAGHTDWLRDYTSALDDVGDYAAPV
ncbi:MAG: hypothetical protein WDM85_04005 [Caulobacteraceae bacterium]